MALALQILCLFMHGSWRFFHNGSMSLTWANVQNSSAFWLFGIVPTVKSGSHPMSTYQNYWRNGTCLLQICFYSIPIWFLIPASSSSALATWSFWCGSRSTLSAFGWLPTVPLGIVTGLQTCMGHGYGSVRVRVWVWVSQGFTGSRSDSKKFFFFFEILSG